MKPENEFLDPPVFMALVLGLPFVMRICRELDLEVEVEVEEEMEVVEDGPSARCFCLCF